MFDEETNFNEKPLNLRKVYYRILNYWYYLPLFLILSMALAIFLYKSTPAQYKISAQLLIKESQQQLTPIGAEETALPGINLGTISNLENQLIILSSSKQIEKSLRDLEFTISYYEAGTFKESEIYNDSPFYVKLDTGGMALPEVKYSLKFESNDQFQLYRKGEKKSLGRYKLFDQLESNGLKFSIIPKSNIEPGSLENRTFSFQITPLQELIQNYQEAIIISDVKPGASVFEISVHENNIQKGKDFINELAQNSVSYTLEKKNQIANNIIHFIEGQLINVGDSLNRTKNMLENFRSRNEMVDISMQGQMIITRTETLELERNIIERQLDYYQYLVSFLENNENILNLLSPSAKGIENLTMEQMIADLSALNAEKQSLQFNSKESNPAIARINRQIEAQKQNILQQARSNVAATQKDMAEINQRLMALSNEIRRLPKKEQVSLDIEQKFQTTDQLHSYLMERRSEAQLAKASNIPDNEIIERADVIKQTKPNLLFLIIMILLLGLIIPLMVIFFIAISNNKIQDKEDLESISKLPFIGVTPRVSSSEVINKNNSNTLFSESIKNIRTAIEFFPLQQESKCILVTSGIAEEGKSLTASNLAISYTQLGKRTLIIDFDMRKPAIGKLFNVNGNKYGVSTYLAQQDAKDIHKLIQSSEEYQLDVIPSGKIPPNPAELISSHQTELLIGEMRKLYDVIIIDSPPIGLVSDALLLSKITDINILVTRHNTTPIPMLKSLLKDYKIKNIKNLCLLLNDYPAKKHAYNNYTYHSKYYNKE
ncbi:exopolysaccharide transport family protein [Marinilabilia sp.]|uniref:exopolysaccharide transport family protein n=1 Tax=Marinilabilia sp. TaxID=2021252 RepID=UPI0025BB45E3|nr:tyrosine-protein kinase [Marinilabilia sp.]